MDEYELLSVTVGDRADHVATIAINRPDVRNALNEQVRTELKDAVTTADKDDRVRVLVLTGGEESGSFIAGADITEFRDRDLVDQRKASERPRIYETVDDASIPIIARINGHALGGGCELAQACDIRIAEAGAKLGQPEINLGLIPGGGGTQRLTRLVGEGHAMRLVLSGKLIDAEEAKEIGLVDEVYDAEQLNDRVYELASSMAEKSPIALKLAKKAIKGSSRMGLEEGLKYESELFVQTFATQDKDEGIDAFLEGREPDFTGK
ncbi:Enoyl-CoA hydratase/carnithine racemase (plasmid) [Natrarchaeobaculum sulfurireducens]|uniref:Enoyl-CoA hydratase/carnithine racemase n=1 Tax=Natrarchaeobaculum sulfurireducens TaxID=2044521 RepID=A0A346PJZ5_9EURY|nr:enoyl-CoA hydratase/carnithine racemase [Natrarchaeobaculum sulfurireducens]AXR79840.1 Enoyl-CoA hydratase/carnithine racemase [Natrarchaeobaculum sulfurireducens]